MSSAPVVILGCGFTGIRVARRLLFAGFKVIAVSRTPEKLGGLVRIGAEVRGWSLEDVDQLPSLPGNAIILHSVPDIPAIQTVVLRDYLLKLSINRLIYISTTGVYGSAADVDANTPACPADEKNQRRVGEEAFTLAGKWSGLVLRPAAIYGPNRGVHTHLKLGREPSTRGGIVSRIHVEDLAAHIESAVRIRLEGAYPVADEYPCSSHEIADFCRGLFGKEDDSGKQVKIEMSGRKVDASATRDALGVQLTYPSYHSGVLACLAQEQAESLI